MIKFFKVLITVINLIFIFLFLTATITTDDEKMSEKARRGLDIGTMILAFNTFAIWWR